MKILVVDSATEKSFLALAEGTQCIEQISLPGGPGLSQELAPAVKKLLEKHRFTPDIIALGQGPGSYTGVRVSAALAKALAFGWRIPITGICSLQFFAPRESQKGLILFDARIGGVYALEISPSFLLNGPRLISLSELTSLPADLPLFSPHPAAIQKRHPLPNPWEETDPNIEWALIEVARRFKEDAISPPALDYLDPKTSPLFNFERAAQSATETP